MVLIILAVLAAIVVFAVQDLSHHSAAASCQSDFRTAESATETFKAQMGAYPGGAYDVGVILSPATPTATDNNPGILDLLGMASTANGVVGPWLKDYPYDAAHFQLNLSTDGKGAISVWSTGVGAAQIGSTDSVADCASVA